MINIREKIFFIIEPHNPETYGKNLFSKIYDILILGTILISIIPLFFKETNDIFNLIDKYSLTVFIIDYILRFITADYKYNEFNIKSFIKYPFSFMAIVDLLSILPAIISINSTFKLFKMLRFTRTIRIVILFKAFRYSKKVVLIGNVLKSSKNTLIGVGMFAFYYIVISALIIFNLEPNLFNTFFDALYLATVSLTTIGYGDIYPVSQVGKVFTMISSIFGIAIIALPASVLTGSYLNEIKKENENNRSNT